MYAPAAATDDSFASQKSTTTPYRDSVSLGGMDFARNTSSRHEYLSKIRDCLDRTCSTYTRVLWVAHRLEDHVVWYLTPFETVFTFTRKVSAVSTSDTSPRNYASEQQKCWTGFLPT